MPKAENPAPKIRNEIIHQARRKVKRKSPVVRGLSGNYQGLKNDFTNLGGNKTQSLYYRGYDSTKINRRQLDFLISVYQSKTVSQRFKKALRSSSRVCAV